jgi:hypothetical protein
MGQLPIFINNDAWDGYPAARTRSRYSESQPYQQRRGVDGRHPFVVGHQRHARSERRRGLQSSNRRRDSRRRVRDPRRHVPGFPDALAQAAEQAALATPHIKFADVSKRGYVVLDVTAERTQAAWHLYTGPEQPTVTEAFAMAYATYDGENRLRQERAPAPTRHMRPLRRDEHDVNKFSEPRIRRCTLRRTVDSLI